MRRIRLVVEYDGTGFHGFQRQPGSRTVQGVLEETLEMVCGHPVSLVGAGRTDAGVHALGQVIHFDTMGRIPVERLERALNGLIGPEILIRHPEQTTAEFHARFGASLRTYHYYVSRERLPPFVGRYVHVDERLPEGCADRMNEALAGLVGTHDFAPLSAVGSERGSTIRTVTEARVESRGALLRIMLSADAFLRSTVRIVTGLLLEIGRGKVDPGAVRETLAEGRRLVPATTAPPQGLFLARVEYPDGYPPRPEGDRVPWCSQFEI